MEGKDGLLLVHRLYPLLPIMKQIAILLFTNKEECVKETSKLKNCPNAPISSHEVQYKEEPPMIVTSSLYWNAL